VIRRADVSCKGSVFGRQGYAGKGTTGKNTQLFALHLVSCYSKAMAKPFLIFCIGILVNVWGQPLKNKLYRKIIQADSVILVSHLTTHIPFVDSKTKQWLDPLRLVVKNKLNDPIVKERYRLQAKETDTLARLLIMPNTDREIEDIGCFIPHHGILIYKMGKCAFFDICFGCRHFVTSKDIYLSDQLSIETWKKLERFFRDRGLRYELPEEVLDGDKVE
jgi:hypothetical protein